MKVIDMKQNLGESFFRVGAVLFVLCMLLPIVYAHANNIDETVCIDASTANVSATTANVFTSTANVSASTADLLTSTANVSTSTANVSASSVKVFASKSLISNIDSWFAALAILLIFGWMILIGVKADKKLDQGEVRRAIAGTFVVGFTILMVLSIKYDIPDNDVTTMYVQLAGIVIAFYFGTRAVAVKRAEAAAMIGIEHVRFLPDHEKIAITIRNGGDSEIKVDKIYINEDVIEESIKISPEKSKETEQNCEWQSETEYKIKIATSTGLTAEIRVSPPEEKTQ
jgi:hypothetical protein